MDDPHASRSFFHACPADVDPRELLNPDRQLTEPWGEPEHGFCDKCAGGGEVVYVCRSCVETGASSDCPSCQGRVRFRETCPACLGDGRIDRTRRRGVAAFPTREGLYRYLAERNTAVEDRLVVEVEGKLSLERDLDADTGALLVHPEEIVEVQPLDARLLAGIRERL
jgi:hypothetical protein